MFAEPNRKSMTVNWTALVCGSLIVAVAGTACAGNPSERSLGSGPANRASVAHGGSSPSTATPKVPTSLIATPLGDLAPRPRTCDGRVAAPERERFGARTCWEGLREGRYALYWAGRLPGPAGRGVVVLDLPPLGETMLPFPSGGGSTSITAATKTCLRVQSDTGQVLNVIIGEAKFAPCQA